MSYERSPKSAKNTYTLTPSVAGVGPAGPFRLSSLSTRGRGASRSQRMRPVCRSRQMVIRRPPRAAVRKMRSRVSDGEEWPKGSPVFQMTFFVGPNSVGRRRLSETPDPLGPRKRDQPSGSGASVDTAAPRNSIATNARIMILVSDRSRQPKRSLGSRVDDSTVLTPIIRHSWRPFASRPPYSS